MADSLAEQMREPMAAMDVDAMYLSALEICADGLSRVLVLDRYGVVKVDTLSILNGTRLQDVYKRQRFALLTNLTSQMMAFRPRA